MSECRFLAVVLLIALAGCTGSSHDDRPTPPKAPAAPRSQIRLGTIDQRELAQRIERLRGKVVLVDFWATWCEPCVELIPHTAALARRFDDRGLAVIAVAFDDEEKRADVVDKLASGGVTFETYLSKYGGSADSVVRFHIEDSALPNLKLYDRRGRLVKTFSGVTDPAEIDRAVEAALREP
jgi:thiol-disulfide isomerase/thioredoxin